MSDKKRFTMPVAVHLFLLRGNEVLLLRRYNTGYEDGKYSVPAGHMDGNEQVKHAAIREAREECGIDITEEDLQVAGVMHRRSSDERIDFFLAASRWGGDITNNEPDKCDELIWVDMQRLPENMIPYVRQAITNYRDGKWFDSFGWREAADQVHAKQP
ncbi:NUDIX hydrolase [Brevibacillus panacihumi]|uniref:NUDIX domain-containing protein n=1 Tax=Brevibacillus panacihumi TaxID=497735 RepID=A0A3M8C6F8_9BACL|nr:NUDIX domain-containing protein [Brevibacillus panacihumi]RNB71290.1 NUDIX domain-containing protein [Brevibacillus panacihumi]